MRLIPIERLSPHPDNPRLEPRQEVVDQIAAAIAAAGRFDEAHALLVRPLDDAFQIVSGHHRRAAAEQAGLAEVPCWVREMGDEEAYMALVTSNAQSELNALERGLHALGATEKGRWGRSVSAYARDAARPQRTVAQEVAAAKVAKVSAHALTSLVHLTRHLAELHAAPDWLWPPLLAALTADGWTVDTARKQAQRFAKTPEPPTFADRNKVAEAIVAGRMSPSAFAQMFSYPENAKLRDQDLKDALAERLTAARPSSAAEVRAIVNNLEDEQAARDKRQRDADLAAQREAEAAAERAARIKGNCSLSEWNTLTPAQRVALLEPDGTVSGFNKQENTAIEWAQWSWNPVTGCQHTCPYCYARDIANSSRMAKVYPNGFEPTIRPRSLYAPRHRSPGPEAKDDIRFRNVFTCSMADLFGRWVPEEWINAVLGEMRSAPSWNFLCLTKFPKRMAEFDIPENTWMGTTVDLQARVAAAEAGFANVRAQVKWLSVEPMLEPLRFKRLDLFDWIVIGGASSSEASAGSPKTPEWKPPFAWIMDLVRQARDAGVKVYFKTNLLGNPARILEMPLDLPVPQDEAALPEVFRYLGREGRAA